ncbi:hypothetical protein OUZ56_001595 [Daphnia magna]|uniref:Uncharacterized protein n=1 Tax=Daphnia magna TaxID=35525 RepID=A0ABR0A360_9CRUS|nr:hypothetical protein OUZ56_001595 [Daphnia magna]
MDLSQETDGQLALGYLSVRCRGNSSRMASGRASSKNRTCSDWMNLNVSSGGIPARLRSTSIPTLGRFFHGTAAAKAHHLSSNLHRGPSIQTL